jgi:hypothetical protein
VGPKGNRGEKGERGDAGPMGTQGPAGPRGEKGEQGPQGPQGPRGDVGPRGIPGAVGPIGPAGPQGKEGQQGPPGESPVLKAQYPIILENGTLSFDSEKFTKVIDQFKNSDIQDAINKMASIIPNGGGAVGIKEDGERIIKSVSDINFTGSGVSVTRQGKSVTVDISGGSGGGGAGISGPYVVSLSGTTGAVNLQAQRGITYTISGNTHSFEIDYVRGGAAFPTRNANSIDKIDVILLQDRDLIGNPKANEMYLVTMDDMLNYFNRQTDAVSFKSSTSLLVTDSDDNTTKRVDYSTFTSTIASLIPGITGATGSQGPQGNTGATGPTEDNIGIFLDSTPDVISTGKKGFKQIAYDCQVTEWYVIGGATGTIEFDVKKSSFANYPTTTSIVGGDYPKLTSQFKNSNTGVTAWSGLSGGDIVDFVINSNTDVESVGLFLKIRRI